MADPISLGASVLAFVGLAERIIRMSKHCIDAIKDAPSDIQMILGEVSSVKAVVESCREPENSARSLVSRLFAPSGPVDACLRCLAGLEGLLPPEPRQDAAGKRRKITLVELAWPLKQSKARKLLAEISHYKASLLLAISGDMSHDIKEIQTTLRRLLQVNSASESREVFQWLERRNPSTLHNSAFGKHEPHTSAWVLRSPEWKKWLSPESDDRFLWLHGLPGSGKTVLASFIIEQLKDDQRSRRDSCLAYYYCHYSHDQDEALPFLAWTISQACRRLGWVPQELRDLFDQGCDPRIDELEYVLQILLARFDTFYLVIDAVDESMPRDDLLSLIAVLSVDKRFQKVRILATSREYFDIERLFSGISATVSMSNPSIDADMRRFVRAKLAASRRLNDWRDMLGVIEDVLVSQANGMFRWVECQVKSIERLRDISQLPPTLKNLPRDISETYVRIFEAIPEADRPFMRQVLMWVIAHSQAPWISGRGINAKVLLSAAAYDVFGPNPNRRTTSFDCESLQELCSCLMTFRGYDGNDDDHEDDYSFVDTSAKQTQRPAYLDDQFGAEAEIVTDPAELFVSLAHYTVLEFLQSPHILQTSVSCFALPQAVIQTQFAQGVLRQAVEANPRGAGTDWVRDREAYCLTLGCALKSDMYLTDPATQDLYLRYMAPVNPHYSRFWGIREELAAGRDGSDSFYLNHLPARYLQPSGGRPRDYAAETFLNLSLVRQGHTIHEDMLQRLLQGRRMEELMQATVRVIVLTGDLWDGDPADYGKSAREREGTVEELLTGMSRLMSIHFPGSAAGQRLGYFSFGAEESVERSTAPSRFVEDFSA